MRKGVGCSSSSLNHLCLGACLDSGSELPAEKWCKTDFAHWAWKAFATWGRVFPRWIWIWLGVEASWMPSPEIAQTHATWVLEGTEQGDPNPLVLLMCSYSQSCLRSSPFEGRSLGLGVFSENFPRVILFPWYICTVTGVLGNNCSRFWAFGTTSINTRIWQESQVFNLILFQQRNRL